MSNVVNFVCCGCEATLSIPLEMAGISGPCPICGIEVTSPQPWTNPGPVVLQNEIVPPLVLEESAARREKVEERVWLQPQLMVDAEPAVAAPRASRTGWFIAAGVLIFAGGVAGAWKLWEPEKPAPVIDKPASPLSETRILPSRPAVLASAEEIPPPSEEMPLPPPASTAVARNLSATPTPAASVPVSDPSDDPGVKTPARASAQATEMSAAEKEIRKVVPVKDNLEKPGTALIRFFAATTWQERLKYSLAPEKVKPLMEEHYKTFRDGPVIPEDIQLTRIEGTEEDGERKYYAFVVFLPECENGIPVSVEDTKNGCLVEWCSFVEAKDQTLAKFCKTYQKEPKTFRVLVRRSHYFENDVPDQDRKECLEVVAPDTAGPFHVWLEKDSAACTRYFSKAERSRWDISTMMVISCQWEKTAKGVQYVRLREVVADSWHPDMLPASTTAKK
ncbi:MAG TPA: hypothetical protein VHM91_15440 [Verrucomicrobiales bacterium]|jgi:hypothetical protein|nr:hypothetical protein [Verrucomicrobiales bacterium]